MILKTAETLFIKINFQINFSIPQPGKECPKRKFIKKRKAKEVSNCTGQEMNYEKKNFKSGSKNQGNRIGNQNYVRYTRQHKLFTD